MTLDTGISLVWPWQPERAGTLATLRPLPYYSTAFLCHLLPHLPLGKSCPPNARVML